MRLTRLAAGDEGVLDEAYPDAGRDISTVDEDALLDGLDGKHAVGTKVGSSRG